MDDVMAGGFTRIFPAVSSFMYDRGVVQRVLFVWLDGGSS